MYCKSKRFLMTVKINAHTNFRFYVQGVASFSDFIVSGLPFRGRLMMLGGWCFCYTSLLIYDMFDTGGILEIMKILSVSPSSGGMSWVFLGMNLLIVICCVRDLCKQILLDLCYPCRQDAPDPLLACHGSQTHTS